MTEKLLVPDIGDFENVEVIELLVKEGQEIKKNDPVITIESDKSSVEIPSIFSGKIESIVVKVGDKVMYAKDMGGDEITMGDEKYLLFNEHQLLGIVQK